MPGTMLWAALDRFSQDPTRANFLNLGNLARKMAEPHVCIECHREIPHDRDECEDCAYDARVRGMTLDKFLAHLEDEVDGYEQFIRVRNGMLVLEWLFETKYQARKAARVLRARGAKYEAEAYSVTFYLGVINKQIELMEV